MAAEQLSLEMTNRGAWADECQLKNILNTAFLSSMSCPQHSVVSTTWVQLLTEREFLFASFQFAVLSQQITLFCLNSYNFQQQYRNLKKNPTRTTSGAARLDLVWNAHLLCAWIPAALSSSIKSGNHKCKDLGSWTQPEKKFEQFFLLQPEPSCLCNNQTGTVYHKKANIISVGTAIWTSDSLRQPKGAPTITAQLKSQRADTFEVRDDTETGADLEVWTDGMNSSTSEDF